jgi:poly-gamma-glutamate capsule biosynthesis protein CapA/YwtB (metallophosphatase superfamily)
MPRYLFTIMLLALVVCRRESGKLTVNFTGDVLLDRGVRSYINQKGPESLFHLISPLLARADFNVANLECPVTSESSPVTKQYVFRAEPRWLETVRKSGITHLGLANNHSMDQGRKGLIETALNLEKNHLSVLGFGNTQQEACRPAEIERNGNLAAVFSSVLLPLENWMYLPDEPGVCQATAEQLAENIRAYRIHSPTAFVVAFLHWGAEYQSFPTTLQRMQADEIIKAGADMIVGHHPHVVQSISFIRGKPVFFSVGNFVFDQKNPLSSKGILVELRISVHNNPLFLIHPYNIDGCVPVPLTKQEAGRYKDFVLSLSEGISLNDSVNAWCLTKK